MARRIPAAPVQRGSSKWLLSKLQNISCTLVIGGVPTFAIAKLAELRMSNQGRDKLSPKGDEHSETSGIHIQGPTAKVSEAAS